MKLLKYIIPVFLGVFTFSSCDEALTDINKDPNQSSSANPAATFTAAQGYYAIAIEAYFNENDALFAQYVAGGPGVALIDEERYFLLNQDFNLEWSNSYNQALSDLSFTIEKGNPALSAAADVLSVHIWQNLVDHFGDIPYTEALKGDFSKGGITTPAYDDAKTIYNDLLARLDVSIETLTEILAEGEEAEAVIGDEDLIYGGDIEKWIRFANSLKLKVLMRQSITDPSVGPQVIELISSGIFIEEESQIVLVPFGGATSQQYNPMFARREAGVGQFYVASESTVDIMEELSDPRLEILYDPAAKTNTIVGLKQGNVENVVPSPARADYSFPSAAAYAEDNDVILMSHWEAYFLRAEAAMRFATADDEKAMFDAAVTASFDYLGAEGVDTYLVESANYNPGATTQAKSDMIGVQKWISMNGLQEFEGYIESRRFDTPESKIFFDPTSGILVRPTRSTLPEGQHPTIRLYPQTEVSFNPNTPSGRAITDKVFWDN